MVNGGDSRGKRAGCVVLGLAAISGLLVATVMTWIAFQENSQGEFYDPISGTVVWTYALALFGLWFVVVSVLVAVAGWISLALLSGIRRRYKLD